MMLTVPANNIPIKPIYLIHGADNRQALDVIKTIHSQLDGAKKYYFANLAQFIDFYKANKSELLNKDLFCGSINKILEISIGNAKFTKQQIQELNDLLNNITSINNVVIILVADKLGKLALNADWAAYINKIGIIIVTKSLSNSDLPKNSVFDLQNALSRQNTEKIILILNNLKAQSQEEILILWSIIQAIKNQLLTAKDLLSKKKLATLLQKAALIDLAIKNADGTNSNNDGYIWGMIIDLCLHFCHY